MANPDIIQEAADDTMQAFVRQIQQLSDENHALKIELHCLRQLEATEAQTVEEDVAGMEEMEAEIAQDTRLLAAARQQIAVDSEEILGLQTEVSEQTARTLAVQAENIRLRQAASDRAHSISASALQFFATLVPIVCYGAALFFGMNPGFMLGVVSSGLVYAAYQYCYPATPGGEAAETSIPREAAMQPAEDGPWPEPSHLSRSGSWVALVEKTSPETGLRFSNAS